MTMDSPPPRWREIVVLAGGVGGARFLRGLLALLAADGAGAAGHPDDVGPPATVTVIGNTGDDITLFGLRVCPDLDTVMYTLGGGIHEDQGWGRADETFAVKDELLAYGAQPQWFGLGDRDIATHVLRSQWLAQGVPLSEVTRRLCERWNPGVRLLPMSDDRVETHVVVEDSAHPDGERTVHFQEWWVRLHAAVAARRIEAVGAATATPAPGVLAAIAAADVIVLPPSNPVVSIGTILQVPGIRGGDHRLAGSCRRCLSRSSAARPFAGWPTPASPPSASRQPRARWPSITATSSTDGWSTTSMRNRRSAAWSYGHDHF